MKSTALLLVAMLAGSQVVHADPAKIVDWPGGVASVRSHGPDGGLALGRIEADGTLVLEWPEPPASGQTLDQTFGACSGEGGLSVGPLDVGFTPTSIYAERDGKELGALHLATSPAVVAWRDSFAQKDAAVGAWLQWVHVTAQSEIAGDCTATVFTDPAATQSYAESTDYAVDFKKGWNLMRNDITEVHGDPTGRKYAQRIRIDAMQETPADVSWFFVAY